LGWRCGKTIDLCFCEFFWLLALGRAVHRDLHGAGSGIDGEDDFGHFDCCSLARELEIIWEIFGKRLLSTVKMMSKINTVL
jgi:hypothetical protein